MLNYFPKWIVIVVATCVGAFELAVRLPDIMLFRQRMTAQSGQYGGEAQSPAAVAANIGQTQSNTREADSQARLNDMQTTLAKLEGDLKQAEKRKTEAEQRLAEAQTTGANLDNTTNALGLAFTEMFAGYMTNFLHALSDNNRGSADTAQSSAPEAAQPHYATVTAINLNLRSGPGVSYPSLGIMPQGTRVVVVREAEDGWLEIEAPGQDGGTVHGFARGKHLNVG